MATVASCLGIALGLLDEWMSGQNPAAPTRLTQHLRLPSGHWNGERAATRTWAQLTDTPPADLIPAVIH